MSKQKIGLAWRIVGLVLVLLVGAMNLIRLPQSNTNRSYSVGMSYAQPIDTDTPTATLTSTATATATSTSTATPTLTPTETPFPSDTPFFPLAVTGIEPVVITSGQDSVVSIFGSSFTNETTVRLVGLGISPTTFVNSTALHISIPSGIAPGGYSIQVSDPVTGSAYAATILTVLAPPATVGPTSEPLPSPEPPTPVPGQPFLLARSFSTNPETTVPGGTITLSFEIVNQGNRAAQGVAVSIGEGSKFVPANGQASATLPDIGAGGRTMVSLTVVVPTDATAGPTAVPVTMKYRDFSGQTYTSDAVLSVLISSVSEASQVVVTSYSINPNPVVPGEPVRVTVSVVNTGNEAANQVLLRVTGGDGLLLAGPEGDSFPLGDMAPGMTVSRELQLVVSSAAKPGPQSQALTLSYLQENEAKTNDGSLTVNVAVVTVAEPLLLLTSYETGSENLQPGQQFTLEMEIQNLGNAPAENVLVTFGTVESDGTGGGTGGGTSTNPSNIFAPVGTGGTAFVELIEAKDGKVTLSQEFIVSGTANSGIYNLPITLRYLDSSGEAVQNRLSASLVVIAPPLMQISLQSPIPEQVNVGETMFASLQITNTGEKTINLTMASIEADNAEVFEGAEVFLGALAKEKNVTLSGVLMPTMEGPVTITITIRYRDDLNREREIVQTYETNAIMMELPPDPGPFPDDTPTPSPEETEDDKNLAGRIIMGLLGLGS